MPSPTPGTPRHRPLADRPWASTLVGGLLALTLAGSIVALVLVREAPAPGVGGHPGGGGPLRSQAASAPIQVSGPQPSSESPAGAPGPGAFPEPEQESGAALPPSTVGAATFDGRDGQPEGLDDAEDPAPPGDETTSEEQNEQETSPLEKTTPAERTSEATKDENPEPERTKDGIPKPERTKPEKPKLEKHESHGQPEAKETSPEQSMPPTPHPGHGGGPPGGEPPGHQAD
jgi:hypothetical protein